MQHSKTKIPEEQA